jgi:hypothetical protein
MPIPFSPFDVEVRAHPSVPLVDGAYPSDGRANAGIDAIGIGGTCASPTRSVLGGRAATVRRARNRRVIRSAPDDSFVEEAAMAGKDKGGSKSSKTSASKTLKEKRQAKREKAAGSGSSSSANWGKK